MFILILLSLKSTNLKTKTALNSSCSTHRCSNSFLVCLSAYLSFSLSLFLPPCVCLLFDYTFGSGSEVKVNVTNNIQRIVLLLTFLFPLKERQFLIRYLIYFLLRVACLLVNLHIVFIFFSIVVC